MAFEPYGGTIGLRPARQRLLIRWLPAARRLIRPTSTLGPSAAERAEALFTGVAGLALAALALSVEAVGVAHLLFR